MTATNQIHSTNKALSTYPSDYSGSTKSLSTPTKNLGGDPALGAWLEQAYAYYNAVMSGAEPMPDQIAWGEFMNQLNWATQNGGGFGDPMTGGYPTGPEQQPIPGGATAGTQGNVVWDNQTLELTHTDDARPQDIWAETFSLDIPNMSADVTAEKVTDTRFNPPEEVTKITVKNKATGIETVYFVHGDAQITVRTAQEGQFIDNTSGAVAWEEYSASVEGSSGAGITGGETEKVDETHSIVTAGPGEVIQATPNKDVEETQFYTVYGELNLSLPADCTADVTQVGGDKVVTVKDRDGKVIAEYTVISGFPVNVNHANEKSITIDGKAVKKGENEEGDETIEGGFDGLSINGLACEGGGGGIFGTGIVQAVGEGILLGANPETQAGKDSEACLQAIAAATGQSYEAICQTLFKKYPNLVSFDKNNDYVLSAEELAEASKAGVLVLPPAKPDQAFMDLLVALDPELPKLLEALKNAKSIQDTLGDFFQGDLDPFYKAVRDRVLGILQAVYAGENHVFGVDGGGKNVDDLQWENQVFDIVNGDCTGLQWSGQ